MIPVTLDLEQLRRNLRREGTPPRVFGFEHGIAASVRDEVARRYDLGTTPAASLAIPDSWQREIAVQRLLGFELFRVWLPGGEFDVAGSLHTTWAEEHRGPIQSWQDIDRYPWPQPQAIDYAQLEFYERHLPGDMGLYHTVKIWEGVRELLGFETFCTKIFEQPDLVDEVIRRVGEFHLALARALCDFRCVFALYGDDDYAYKTSTMMAPRYIIERFLPWHARMAQEAHQRDKLYFFHACGKMDPLMDHLIDSVHIDAKHSFEDTIVPVTEAKRRWGHRVALLGGLDVDFIARSDEAAVRRRVRETLDVCYPGGGYCLGLGNWVTDYIPVDNYLAVVDEGRRYTLQ
jgi:uroporphyrinogen decarboxylase